MATTPTEVKEIYPTDMTETQIQAYINVAEVIVAANVTCGLSTTVLEEIERWLTAHLIASTQERQTKSERLGEAEVVYTGEYGPGLESTTYGQTAMMLDSCGGLAAMGKKAIKMTSITSFE